MSSAKAAVGSAVGLTPPVKLTASKNFARVRFRVTFAGNSLTSRVLAVNQDWGFVVIDAGKSTGLTQDTKLIVTRGSLTVGKISVMNVEDTRSMATIVPDAVINGMTIMPGDRVILENLLQN